MIDQDTLDFANTLTSHPNSLDNIAPLYGLKRKVNETDDELAERIRERLAA